MSELQRRLTRLEIEDANDRQEIVHAQARIDAREAVIRLLRAQILINKSLEDGTCRYSSGPAEEKLMSDIQGPSPLSPSAGFEKMLHLEASTL